MKETTRAGLIGRGARGNFYWRAPCKSYVFADSQGCRLFFPIIENVLTQMHMQLAARSKYWSIFLLRKNISLARE